MSLEWKCPRCEAPANAHGKGGKSKCKGPYGNGLCEGFLCECDDDTDDVHGSSYAEACPAARCHHCLWTGVFPAKPKGLAAWEQKALDAGWEMPAARKKELGL